MRRAFIPVTIPLLALGAVSAHSIAFAGGKPAQLEVDGLGRVDPVASALGVAADERHLLSDAQEELSGGDGSRSEDEQREVDAVRAAAGIAVDDLYERVSGTDEGRRAQEAWRACIGRAGLDYDDPAEIELGWDALEPGDESGERRLLAAAEQSLRCEEQSSALVDEAVRAVYPDWIDDHRATFDRYRRILGLG